MKNRQKDNRGFSVITVLIAIAFIGIMAMLVLYISMTNLQMKTTDLKAKDSFYTAENALDEIRAGLQEDVGEAMSDAYVEVMEAYTDEKTSNVESLDVIRKNAFKEKYLKKLRERLQSPDNENLYSMEKIKGYVDLAEKLSEEESLKIVNPQGKSPEMTKGGMESGILLKNLKVIYVDPKGRASIIETDIRLGIPGVTFPTPSTLPDLMNMIVVANQGIVFGEETEALNTRPVHIKGSMYAGSNPDTEENGSAVSMDVKEGQEVYLDSGENLVCLGEILVNNNGLFANKGSTDLWAQGLSVSSGTVELTGKTYLADDMTLNTTQNRSTGSTVSVSGEYYGYGSPESAKESYFADNKYAGWSDTAMSSAIIVNGKGTTLDLSGVTKFMLAGNSYIGSRKLPAGQGSNSGDVLTGESLTVKANQLAYLVDQDCFADDTYTNPMTYDTYAAIEEADVTQIFDFHKGIAAWGGRSLSELGLDADQPVQKVFYAGVDGGYVYFYLNFTDSAQASQFFAQYYAGSKEELDSYLDFYLGEDNGIFMKDPSAFLRYITKGNVLTYTGGENSQGKVEQASGSVTTETQSQEQTNMQNMWYALTRKMITSYDLLKEEVKKDGVFDHSERDENRYVFDNLVDEKGLKEFLQNQGSSSEYKFEITSQGETLAAYVADNESKQDFVIDEEMAETTRLVVATGNVVLKSDVDFSGIIMAGGTLTLKPGSSLSSAPLEAAKVFQAQRENEGQTAPMDFFWEGDKYILGNSLADKNQSSEENGEDIYDPSACVAYENWRKK